MKPSAVIIGYGRFGQLLAATFKDDLEISVVESDQTKAEQVVKDGFLHIDLKDAGKSTLLFLAVPISAFESTVKDVASVVTKGQIVVDMCSVKVYPAKVMQQHLSGCSIIASHPLFGPDSARSGLVGLKVALCNINATESECSKVADLWSSKGVEVINTTPKQHDQDTAYSQAFTYSVARFIQNMDVPDITFDTKSFQAITKVSRLSANDSDQLFHDMMFYNPYFRTVLQRMNQAWSQTDQTLQDIASETAPEQFIDLDLS